jgi:methanogenic corrinoid protein MtbC1
MVKNITMTKYGEHHKACSRISPASRRNNHASAEADSFQKIIPVVKTDNYKPGIAFMYDQGKNSKENKMVNLNEIAEKIQAGKAKEASCLINRAINEDYSIDRIVREGLVAGMTAVDRRFRKNEISIPDLLIAERAMNMGIQIIQSRLSATAVSPKGTVVIGTLEGDILEREKNLTSIMMQGLGLRVIDLGVSVSTGQLIAAAIEEKAQIIACSAALTTYMPQMKSLVQAANSARIRDSVKILISGGPVTVQFCRCIGADMYAPDVISAAEMASAYFENQAEACIA